jgi:hypothetical protein
VVTSSYRDNFFVVPPDAAVMVMQCSSDGTVEIYRRLQPKFGHGREMCRLCTWSSVWPFPNMQHFHTMGQFSFRINGGTLAHQNRCFLIRCRFDSPPSIINDKHNWAGARGAAAPGESEKGEHWPQPGQVLEIIKKFTEWCECEADCYLRMKWECCPCLSIVWKAHRV